MQLATFKTGNNVLVVMTKQGQVLVDSSARTLVFNNSGNLVAGAYYPGGGVNGIYIDSANGTDIPNAYVTNAEQ